MPLLLNGARGVVGRGLDFGAALHRLGDALLHQLPEQRQAGLRRIPMRRRDLRLRQPHQAVARFERVIEEGELVVARERREPQRQLGEIGGERVLVDAIEAALRDQATGVQFLVLVRRNDWLLVRMARPCLDQPRRDRAAGLDQERARAHGRIADLEIENLLRRRVRPEPLERRLERIAHDRLGETAWRVMAAGPPALVGRLQQRRARSYLVFLRRAALVDDRIERNRQVGGRLRRLHGLADIRRELRAVGFLLEKLDAVLALGGGEFFEIDEHRGAIVLAGLDGERAPHGALDREAHDGLVDRPDLFDVERTV